VREDSFEVMRVLSETDFVLRGGTIPKGHGTANTFTKIDKWTIF
jgi:hypothetical protein